MKLVLVMIVKNESKIIERCLSSIQSICDAVVISDTGSTDHTIQLINDFLTKNSIPGKVYSDEWKHFGYNRTKSLTNAQEWLDEQKYDKKDTYLLTIDADMLFRITPEFDKNQLTKYDSWTIQQKNPNLTYYNKRLFRSSLKYRCIGVTHEYWGCDDQQTESKMDSIYIDDIGDGGSKSDKYERDIRLLTQGLIDEPNNERYYFYLAQSYSDFGNKEEAIKWYKKRIEAGGWSEEIFIAYVRLGELYMHLNQPENAIHQWSLGYDHLPTRSETLYRIINHFRNRSKNNIALSYLKTALKIEYPKDQVLFIEHNVYKYKLIEELSIIGFYTKERHNGFIACNVILFDKQTQHLKKQCSNNIFFYMKKLSPQPIHTLEFKMDEPYLNSSLSLLKNKKGYFGVVRGVNYSITKEFKYVIRDPQNHVKTKNYWVTMDEKGVVLKQSEIVTSCKPKRESHIIGLEDIRICKINEQVFGLCVSFEYGLHNHPSVCLCIFDKNEIKSILPTNYQNQICQKNWVPFTQDNKLFAIYSYHPFTLLEINKKTAECTVVFKKESKYDLSDIRGSASPILIEESWYILTHQVIDMNTRKYYHRFLKYSSNWELEEVSLPFFFEELFVEFSLSISYHPTKNEITVFFSKEDNSSKMVSVHLFDIQWIPNDINKWIKNI